MSSSVSPKRADSSPKRARTEADSKDQDQDQPSKRPRRLAEFDDTCPECGGGATVDYARGYCAGTDPECPLYEGGFTPQRLDDDSGDESEDDSGEQCSRCSNRLPLEDLDDGLCPECVTEIQE